MTIGWTTLRPSMLTLWFSVLGLCATSVLGYIPAQATNDTSAVSVTNSQISLTWTDGTYAVPISFQLTGSGSVGYSRGAIVHYSEDNSTAPPTDSPFIAFISCDRNVTNTTLDNDIFTMANSSGAVAALLYTTTSQACLINPDYANAKNFDRVLDIYTTVRMSNAKLIESRWSDINQAYYWYNSSSLNASYNAIEPYYLGNSNAPTRWLLATLVANISIGVNSTGSGDGGNGAGGSGSNNLGGGSGGSPNTSTAMIILYAITGCVSLLFSIVVILGAVRAIRHPERYGPRPATMGRWRAGEYHPSMHAPPQSRAAGLGRAVLDSFPLIKFGATTPANPYPTYDDEPPQPQKTGDLESAGAGKPATHEEGMEMDALPPINTAPGAGTRDRRESHASISTADPPPSPSHPRPLTSLARSPSADQPQDISNSALPLSSSAEEASAADAANILAQSQIGTETCPICIVDFQNGDDLRVLPCAGRHRFHQACVDPWLLELSSSCPICRADFATLETIVVANTSEEGHDHDGELEPETDPVAGEEDVQITPAPSSPIADVPQPLATPSTTGGGASARVSRYLRFAQSRRGQAAATRAPR